MGIIFAVHIWVVLSLWAELKVRLWFGLCVYQGHNFNVGRTFCRIHARMASYVLAIPPCACWSMMRPYGLLGCCVHGPSVCVWNALRNFRELLRVGCGPQAAGSFVARVGPEAGCLRKCTCVLPVRGARGVQAFCHMARTLRRWLVPGLLSEGI
jgi:hypothetical protein